MNVLLIEAIDICIDSLHNSNDDPPPPQKKGTWMIFVMCLT